jgi:hypothetical protein
VKKLLCIAALVCTAGQASANGEPPLSWEIQRIDGDGAVQPQIFNKGNFDGANLQIRTLCDKALAERMKWPEVSGVRVTVRPFMAKPEDSRMRTADISCDEVRTNKDALQSKVPRPKNKPAPEQKLIQLWD